VIVRAAQSRWRELHPFMRLASAFFALHFLVPVLQDNLDWIWEGLRTKRDVRTAVDASRTSLVASSLPHLTRRQTTGVIRSR
jgi:hypothetical protein